MFLKFLEKIGRKKIVLDRGPSHPQFSEAKPWMERYYLLFRRRPKWFPFNVLIHRMLDDDHGDGNAQSYVSLYNHNSKRRVLGNKL